MTTEIVIVKRGLHKFLSCQVQPMVGGRLSLSFYMLGFPAYDVILSAQQVRLSKGGPITADALWAFLFSANPDLLNWALETANQEINAKVFG